MRVLVQRVSEASVSVEGQVIGAIGQGLVALVCALEGDTVDDARAIAARAAKLRIFHDDAGKMNRALTDIDGACLAISQFTLAADLRSGNRPGFSAAAPPDEARQLVEVFIAELVSLGIPVETGRFAAEMRVSLVNEGPVTIMLDSLDRRR